MQFECYICNDTDAEDGEGNDCCALVPCGHVSHKLCMDKWIKTKPPTRQSTCPVCRMPFTRTLVLYGSAVQIEEQQQQPAVETVDQEILSSIREDYTRLYERHSLTVQDLEEEKRRCDELELQLSILKEQLDKALFKFSLCDEMYNCSEQLEKLIADCQNQ